MVGRSRLEKTLTSSRNSKAVLMRHSRYLFYIAMLFRSFSQQRKNPAPTREEDGQIISVGKELGMYFSLPFVQVARG